MAWNRWQSDILHIKRTVTSNRLQLWRRNATDTTMQPSFPLLLQNTSLGPVVKRGDRQCRVPDTDWDEVFKRDNIASFLRQALEDESTMKEDYTLLPPIGSQELWAAGVTYYRSRTARMDEAKEAGGSNFYDRVYNAERPELFMKATPHRVVGHAQAMKLRADSRWNVPEPEVTLAINANATIVGYTIGNDLSSRDIEGENPLYLPQAKTWDRCAAVGPAIWITEEPIPGNTEIKLRIARHGETAFEGATTLDQMKQTFENLVDYLYREASFPAGCLLMTGTGVVPGDDFSLTSGDEVHITIEPIGTLINKME